MFLAIGHLLIVVGFFLLSWPVALILGVVEARKYGLPGWLGFLIGFFTHIPGVIALILFMFLVDHLSPGPAQGPYRIDPNARPPA